MTEVGPLDDTGRERRLLELLPLHLRKRDEQSGGTLRALLSAVADELAVLETDIEDLYDGWFVETCAEWLVPYLADLVGIDEPLPDLGVGTSWRTVVGSTVGYRRRKGTVAVLEQIARDVTGWPARAVEYFGLLAATTHVNHVRTDRPAVASLRRQALLDLTGAAQDLRAERTGPPPVLLDLTRGALDRLTRTAEVRSIEQGRGRHGIPRVGIFLFPWQTYEVGEARPTGPLQEAGWAQARPSEGAFTVDPLGYSAPLFAALRTGSGPGADSEHLAQEADLPVPLRPRRLLALLQEARAGVLEPADLPLAVRIGRTAEPLPPKQLLVCGLEDPGAPTGDLVYVDALTGRLHVHRNGARVPPGTEVFVRYAHGGVADVGAGTYDRSELLDQALVTDPFEASEGVVGQVAVRIGATESEFVVSSVRAGLARACAALAAHPRRGATYVVAVGDSARYEGDLTAEIPEHSRVVLVAAAWPQRQVPGSDPVPPRVGTYVPDALRPHVQGRVEVVGGRGGGLVLDGLVLDGDLTVGPGRLGGLTVSQCTIGGRVRVAADEHVATANGELRVSLVRSVVGGVELAASVPLLDVGDSVVDSRRTQGEFALMGAGARLSVRGSTVRGEVRVRSVSADSSILDGLVQVEHRQTGCLRFCFVRPESRVPRRFRCVPGEGDRADIAPVYAAEDPGSPLYLALARSCPAVIAEGSEGGAEMGVHHHLGRPLRLRAAHRHLAPYVPAGLEIGIFGS